MKFYYPKILLFIPLSILSFLYTRGVTENIEKFILIAITSILSSILIFQIVSLATKNKLYATLSLLIFITWGIFSINFNSPIIFSLTFGLLMCFLFLHFSKTGKARYLFLAGASTFIAVIFYKYLLFLSFIPPLIFIVFHERNKILNFLTFLYGFIWGFILFAVYLLVSNLFPLFVNNYLIFRKFKLSFETLNFQTFMLFFLPFILIVLSSFILLKRRKFHLFYLSIFAAIFSFSIIPNLKNPDYLYLALSLSGIPLSIILRFAANSTVKTICIIFSALLVLAGAIIMYGYN